MLVYIYRFIYGYLHLKLKTQRPERFLNLCSANNINIYKTSFKGGVLYFKTNISSFKMLKKINLKFKGKVHIISKKGLPFILFKYRKRYGILVGTVLFVFIIFFMSDFVWNVEIKGASEENIPEISSTLEAIGLKEGIRISAIDPKVMRNNLLLNANGLSWGAVNIEGCTVTVDVKETNKKEEISKEPTNLKAECGGIITKIEALEGTTIVRVGDAVSKGDLLISGIIEYKDLHTQLVRAKGKVYAETEKTIKIVQPLKINEKVKIGKTKKRSVISFFGIKIPLYFGDISNEYICETTEQYCKVLGVKLPIKIVTKKFEFVKDEEKYFSVSNAKILAEKNLEKEINEYILDGKLLSKNITEYSDKNNFVLIAKLKCEKNIILEEKMLISTRN